MNFLISWQVPWFVFASAMVYLDYSVVNEFFHFKIGYASMSISIYGKV